MTERPQRYLITLAPVGDGPPAEVRVRRALKCLLRSFGLRCTAVRLADPDASTDKHSSMDLPSEAPGSPVETRMAAGGQGAGHGRRSGASEAVAHGRPLAANEVESAAEGRHA
jgi:hypothetical protein